jgi:hypothetical protein
MAIAQRTGVFVVLWVINNETLHLVSSDQTPINQIPHLVFIAESPPRLNPGGLRNRPHRRVVLPPRAVSEMSAISRGVMTDWRTTRRWGDVLHRAGAYIACW